MPSHENSEVLIRAVQYRHVIFLISFITLLFIHNWVNPENFNIHLVDDVGIYTQTIFFLLIFVPGRILGWYSMGCAMLPLGMRSLSCREQTRDFKRFILCYVTKGENTEVRKGISVRNRTNV